ncbi:MAG: PQQ-binding-like beta-propeller repeat protein [Pseudomonadota bacterium]
MTGRWAALAGLCIALALAGCTRENILVGERLDLRAPLDLPPTETTASRSTAFSAPAQQRTTSWTHRAANPVNRPPNAALSGNPQLIWSRPIGSGNDRRHRITADPVVTGGRIFTLDSRATVTATSANGQTLWSVDLTPLNEREDDASGGGLATDGTRIFVTTGFGRLTALDASNGAEIWVQRLGAASSSAPTVDGGTVFVVSTDSRGWAVDARTGRVQWETAGLPSPSGVVGGGSPAVSAGRVYLPLNSGELLSVFRQSGLRIWNTSVSGRRLGRVYARITDVTGDPVIVGDTIYTGNPSGRTMALEVASGERLWTADYGALGPPVVAGGSAFVISDRNELVRLDAATGALVWSVELPYFVKERPRRREAIFDHYGPTLAGSRLVVVSGDGQMRLFSPQTGALVGAVEVPGGAASLPAVVGGTLYVVSGNGQLHAYR